MTTKTYAITSQPYYDTYNTCYKNILVINAFPEGQLARLVSAHGKDMDKSN